MDQTKKVEGNGLTEEQRQRYDELGEALESGVFKKWTLPNSSEDFDEERAHQNFLQIVDAGVTKRLMDDMKDVYGS